MPCTALLEAAVTDHAAEPGFADRLARRIDELDGDWDVIVLDTPPGLGPLSSMAMLAGRWVVVPARPADFDVGGAVKLADLIAGELSAVNPELQLLGVLVTQVDRRWTLTADTREALAAADVQRLRSEIPFMVRTGAAPRQGAPTVLLEPDCRLAIAYRELAADLATLLDADTP